MDIAPQGQWRWEVSDIDRTVEILMGYVEVNKDCPRRLQGELNEALDKIAEMDALLTDAYHGEAKAKAEIAALQTTLTRTSTAARRDTSLSPRDPLLEFIVAQVDAALSASPDPDPTEARAKCDCARYEYCDVCWPKDRRPTPAPDLAEVELAAKDAEIAALREALHLATLADMASDEAQAIANAALSGSPVRDPGEEAMKRIPIAAAKRIAEEYGYHQVIVIARAVGPNGGEHVTTYGVDPANCSVAARVGDFIKHKIMMWPEKIVDD